MKTQEQWQEWFARYHSNTLAGSGNQSWFAPEDAAQPITGRVFYRVFAGGEYRYSLLFGDTMDSTFADGSHSWANQTLGGWTIHSARVGVVSRVDMERFEEPQELLELTFEGEKEKRVAAGEQFACDPVCLRAQKGQYICLETTVSGPRIPCHPESLLPAFVRTAAGWEHSVNTLFAGMVGCDRPVKACIGYLGDSITQGIGTQPNSYDHWAAVLSEALGEEYAFWDLGLGYARARDAATGGCWLQKALHNDLVVFCMGVNDLGYEARPRVEAIERSLQAVVRSLKQAGVRVLQQTLPPFDYSEEMTPDWLRINAWVREELAQEADALFDVTQVLSLSDEEPQRARYGGHPDALGCRRWAEALEPVLSALVGRVGRVGSAD